MTHLPVRLRSIDVFRAITMLLMIFVNDVSNVKNIPAWIGHVEADEDGLGFADTVFPCFLFIVGLSLPFAIEKRLDKGSPAVQVTFYILSRALALIVMGFFHVNLESYNPAGALLPLPVWQILITVSFFLIWLDYSPELSLPAKFSLIGIGVSILILMAMLYSGGTATSPVGMKPSWWGILGIIGWAYLANALLYLLAKGRLFILLVFLLLFIALNIGIHGAVFKLDLPIIGDASAILLVLSGVLVTLVYKKMSAENKSHLFLAGLGVAGVVIVLSGLVIRPYTNGISKIHSTPAWVFICTGISMVFFAFLTWLIDIQRKQRWFTIILPAGTSTLTCYLLPYFLYAIYSLLNFRYPEVLNTGAGGITRSILVAILLIVLTGLLEKVRFRLKI
jgi:predicted acyltransferase